MPGAVSSGEWEPGLMPTAAFARFAEIELLTRYRMKPSFAVALGINPVFLPLAFEDHQRAARQIHILQFQALCVGFRVLFWKFSLTWSKTFRAKL